MYKKEGAILLNFDGACFWSNGGPLGWGYIIEFPNGLIEKKYGGVLPSIHNSSNVAEYLGMTNGLERLAELKLFRSQILVVGDSNMVISQMKGTMKISRGRYVEYAHRAKNLINKFTDIEFLWVPRSLNKEADYLAGLGVDCTG